MRVFSSSFFDALLCTVSILSGRIGISREQAALLFGIFDIDQMLGQSSVWSGQTGQLFRNRLEFTSSQSFHVDH